MLTVKEAIEQRRSIRRFRPDPVSQEMLNQVLESARLAPSGGNSQPWRFLVATDDAERKKLRAVCFGMRMLEEAPVTIVCCADVDVYSGPEAQRRRQELILSGALDDLFDSQVNERLRSGEVITDERTRITNAFLNCAIAIEHMVLTATGLGLGTCWIGGFRGGELRRMYDLPRNIFVVALLPLGFPAQSPPARPRLSMEEILLGRPSAVK